MAFENVRDRFQQARQQRLVNFNNAFWSDVGNYVQKDIGDINIKNKTLSFPTDTLPSKDLLWNKYNALAKNRGVSADYTAFIQNFESLKNIENQKFYGLLTRAEMLGMKPKDIKAQLQANPNAYARMNRLFATSDPTIQADMKKLFTDKGLLEKFNEYSFPLKAATVGGGVLAGRLAYNKAKGMFGSGKAEAVSETKTSGTTSNKAAKEVVEMQKTKVEKTGLSTKDFGIKGAPEFVDKDKLTAFKTKQYQIEKTFWEQDNPGKTFKKQTEWSKGKDAKYLLNKMSSDELKAVAGKKYKTVTKNIPVKSTPKVKGKGWGRFKPSKSTVALIALQAAYQLLGSDED